LYYGVRVCGPTTGTGQNSESDGCRARVNRAANVAME
jgi:hypothetical protein